jgi:hypothetical protein
MVITESSKLHVFGCSFSTHRYYDLPIGEYPDDNTNYAGVIASELNIPRVCHALEGSNNRTILNRLRNAIQNNIISNDSFVIVQLTHPNRITLDIQDNTDTVVSLSNFKDLTWRENFFTEYQITDNKKYENFIEIFEKHYYDASYFHDLYLNTIVLETEIFRKEKFCNVAILPWMNKIKYQTKYNNQNNNNLAFCTNPWEFISIVPDERFDHLTHDTHVHIGRTILDECLQQGLEFK